MHTVVIIVNVGSMRALCGTHCAASSSARFRSIVGPDGPPQTAHTIKVLATALSHNPPLYPPSAMREIVHLQAGQCGNQIGAKFWEVRIRRRGKGLRRQCARCLKHVSCCLLPMGPWTWNIQYIQHCRNMYIQNQPKFSSAADWRTASHRRLPRWMGGSDRWPPRRGFPTVRSAVWDPSRWRPPGLCGVGAFLEQQRFVRWRRGKGWIRSGSIADALPFGSLGGPAPPGIALGAPRAG